MKYLIALVVLGTLVISCKGTKEIVEEPVSVVKEQPKEDLVNVEKGDSIVVYSRGACFGTCPVFTVDIFENGYADYSGRNNTDKQGLWRRKLSKAEMNRVKNAISKSDYLSLQNEYKSMVADLPKSVFTFITKDTTKTISAKEQMPDELKNLGTILYDIAEQGEWTAISKDAKEIKPEIIFNEIMVQFKKGTHLPSWFKTMKDDGFRLITRLDDEKNIWVIGFDSDKYRGDDAIARLKEDDAVISAEFNVKVKNR